MHKPIMIVGEFLNEISNRTGKPLDGPGGGAFISVLRQAGINLSECYCTNVFQQLPPRGRYEGFLGPKADALPGFPSLQAGKYVKAEFAGEIARLQEEIDRIQPNVIIALGNMALWALTKKSGIKKHRGAPTATHDGRHKVIPTWTPLSIVRQWSLRAVVLSDMAKARRESASPELNRPRRLIHMEPSLQDIQDFYDKYLINEPFVSCDIETRAKTITEVGFSTAAGDRAIVIPFYSRSAEDGNYWDTKAEELRAWKLVRMITREKPTIGQNFSYDMAYLWRTVGIPCPKFAGDTMILHHAMHPELEKGLGFLGSIYTNEPSWKFMRQDGDKLKKGDE